MDPITHTLTGVALSRAGLGRTTPLATAALVVAANAPDIDILAFRAGPYAALAFRRGWTHGPLAALLLPFVVTGGVLLWDRFVRRRSSVADSPGSTPPHPDPRPRNRGRGDRSGSRQGGGTHGHATVLLGCDAPHRAFPPARAQAGESALRGDDERQGQAPRESAYARAGALPPARAPALLLISFIGVFTHPVLDWLNTYGVRWLMPLERRWFYGDAVFIIDPWLWLVLGGSLFLASHGSGERTGARLAGWVLLATLLSAAVLVAPMVSVAVKLVWIAGLVALAVSLRRRTRMPPYRLVRVALAAAAAYIVVMVVASAGAERSTRDAARRAGLDPRSVMFQPSPANPFAGSVVVATDTAYHLGPFAWLGRPQVMFSETIARGDTVAPAVVAAMRDREVRDFLVWSRFPIVRVLEGDDGEATVFVGDARYPDESLTGGGLGGVRVRVQQGGGAAP